MALKGTLRDFGVSDIFQLIAHQSKTGVLTLKNAEHEVRITFREGNVVRAESTTRERRELLGAMLVRAQALSQQQLDTALDIQRRTMRRLGDILVEAGYVSRETLRDLMRLQTTETIYKLFLWHAGTYEFTQMEVPASEVEGEPLRAESVLMEGVRMVDEWPLIRRHITSYAMTFRIIRQVPGATAAPAGAPAAAPKGDGDFLDGLDSAFDSMESGAPPPKNDDDDKLGKNERLVFSLVIPAREVQQIIDLSRLGEFETCKALYNLVGQGYLEAIPARATAGAGLTEGGALEPKLARLPRGLRIQQASGAIVGVLLFAVAAAGAAVVPLREARTGRIGQVRPAAALDAAGDLASDRLRRALEVHRLASGSYPETLEGLVESGLVSAHELRGPYQRRFAYARTETGYQLVRPFY